jgi:hypothetical protein
MNAPPPISPLDACLYTADKFEVCRVMMIHPPDRLLLFIFLNIASQSQPVAQSVCRHLTVLVTCASLVVWAIAGTPPPPKMSRICLWTLAAVVALLAFAAGPSAAQAPGFKVTLTQNGTFFIRPFFILN